MKYYYEDIYDEHPFCIYIKTPFVIEATTMEEATKKAYSSGYGEKCRPIYDEKTNTIRVTNDGVITKYLMTKPEKMDCCSIDAEDDELTLEEEMFLLCLAAYRNGRDKKHKDILFESIGCSIVPVENSSDSYQKLISEYSQYMLKQLQPSENSKPEFVHFDFQDYVFKKILLENFRIQDIPQDIRIQNEAYYVASFRYIRGLQYSNGLEFARVKHKEILQLIENDIKILNKNEREYFEFLLINYQDVFTGTDLLDPRSLEGLTDSEIENL